MVRGQSGSVWRPALLVVSVDLFGGADPELKLPA